MGQIALRRRACHFELPGFGADLLQYATRFANHAVLRVDSCAQLTSRFVSRSQGYAQFVELTNLLVERALAFCDGRQEAFAVGPCLLDLVLARFDACLELARSFFESTDFPRQRG